MLKTINAHAAAIDVGSEQLYVAVVDQAVQVFDTFTESLHALPSLPMIVRESGSDSLL